MSGYNKKAMRSSDQTDRTAQTKVSANKPIQLDNTTNKSGLSTAETHRKILNLIGTGEENAIHLNELTEIVGIDNRELRKCIEHLRRSGVIILSSQKGYFKPLRQSELNKYIHQETRRAKSIFRTLKAARKFLKGDPKQWQKEECLQKQ